MPAARLFCFLLCTIVTLNTLFAQRWEDVVYLRNGSVIRGKLTQPQPPGKVQIESNRNLWVFSQQEVLRLTQERYSPNWTSKGYYGLTETGLLIGASAYNGVNSEQSFRLEMVNGYRFHRLLAAGAGIGVNFYQESHLIPLYAELRGELLNQQLTPFYVVQAGYGLPLSGQIKDEQAWGPNAQADGGWMYGAGLGLAVHTAKVSWLFGMGIRLQQNRTHYFDWAGTSISDQLTHRRLGLQIGVMY